MKIWSAPDLHYLLDEHLKQARLELLADGRLKVKAEDDGGEDPGFVAELIVDKLEAAAQAGFDAVEASLRVSASEYLGERGLAVLQIRGALASACQRLVPPKRPHLEKVEMGAVPTSLIACLLSCAGIVASFFLWELDILVLPVYIVLVLCSIGAGFALFRWMSYAASRQRLRLIDEWPARVCRHYSGALHEGMAYYEHVVRTAARGGTLIPWR